jgi:hypothetical protein
MITGFFLQVITAVANFLVGLLPVINIPTGWTDAITLIWGYVNAMSFLLPISTLLTILGLVVTIEVAVFVWHFSLKLYYMIRG